jgi:hypothetical protein
MAVSVVFWLALRLAGGEPGPARAQEADPVAVARSFGVAGNARDAEAVVAHFARDAVVREPRLVWDTAPDGSTVTLVVYGAHLTGAHDAFMYSVPGSPPFTLEGEAIAWRGPGRIREWAQRLFALRHRAAADGFAADAERVTWRYRVQVDHYQIIPGVPAAEGTAAVTVRGGRITELELAPAAGSLEAREAAVRAALSHAAPPRTRWPPNQQPAGHQLRGAGATASESYWPLAAACLGVGAWVVSTIRGRARRARRAT